MKVSGQIISWPQFQMKTVTSYALFFLGESLVVKMMSSCKLLLSQHGCIVWHRGIINPKLNGNKPILQIVVPQTGIALKDHSKRHHAKRNHAGRHYRKGIARKGITLAGITEKESR